MAAIAAFRTGQRYDAVARYQIANHLNVTSEFIARYGIQGSLGLNTGRRQAETESS